MARRLDGVRRPLSIPIGRETCQLERQPRRSYVYLNLLNTSTLGKTIAYAGFCELTCCHGAKVVGYPGLFPGEG